MEFEQDDITGFRVEVPLEELRPLRSAAFDTLLHGKYGNVILELGQADFLIDVVEAEVAGDGASLSLTSEQVEWLASCFDRAMLSGLIGMRTITAVEDLRVAAGVARAEAMLDRGLPPDFA